MERETPGIAVVIPCYNAQAYIADTINSVLAQNLPGLEIIVADDGSSDASVDIIKSFGDAVRLEICSHRGACHARNRGVELARADYVLFLDADDSLHGDYLLQMAHSIRPGTDVVVGAFARKENGVVEAPFTLAQDPRGDCLLAKYLTDFLQTSALLWRRDFIQANGGWDETLPIFQDVDFALRMLMRDPAIAYAQLRDSYAIWLQHDAVGRITNSMSEKKAATILAVLQKHRPALTALGRGDINIALARRFYWHAGVAFATSNLDIGRVALADAKSLARLPIEGSLANRLITKLLGLERKTRLSALSYRLVPRPRPWPYSLAR